jgi:hypothetical protein
MGYAMQTYKIGSEGGKYIFKKWGCCKLFDDVFRFRITKNMGKYRHCAVPVLE